MIASPQQLSYFLELTQTLNFSRAAERIGISQPSLSSAIQRLEHALGASLFNRNSNGVTLTKAGKRLLLHTKKLLQLWNDTKAASLASESEVTGCVTLGCHPSVALHSLPQILSPILGKYPELEIQLKHDLSRKIVENIINFSIDVGIVVNPVKHPDLILQKLYNDQVTFWQPLKSKKLSLQANTIICDPELTQTQWLLKRAEKLGNTFSRMLTSSNLELVAKLTAEGVGLGILPESIALSCGRITKVNKMSYCKDEIYLAYRPEHRGVKSVQVITTAIKNYFNAMKAVIPA